MAASHDDLAIDLRDVTKVYKGKIHALRGIEMRVRRGEIFGLLGPNGAGKSTLVKIMMTVVRPTRAVGSILGRRVGDKSTLRRVGYLPENHRFPRYLTGRQTVEFFGALCKVDRRTRKRRAAELIEMVGMTGAADRKISTYSKGMAQRTGLAQALIGDPDLVVLDEPTDGVDPTGRRDIRECLQRIRAEGKTVFVNSHLLSELEVISDRLAILVGGQVAKQGTIDELTVAKQRYEFEFQPTIGGSVTADVMRVLPEVFGIPPAIGAPVMGYASGPVASGFAPDPASRDMSIRRGKLDTGEWAELQNATLRVGITDATKVQPLIDLFRREGLVIRRVQMIRPSLEELFMETVELSAPAPATRAS